MHNLSNSQFQKLISFLKNKKVLISTHDLIDIDAFSSCFLFKTFINNYFNSENLYSALTEFSKPTRDFINKLSLEFPETNFKLKNDYNLSDIDVFIVLDTNNIDQVNIPDISDILDLKIPIIFLDHHINLEKNCEYNIKEFNIIDDSFSSTAEIIYELFNFFNIQINLPCKYLLTAAILSDSGFFQYGNNETIKRVANLLDRDLNFQNIVSILRNEEETSSRIARIRGLQRVKLIKEGDWLIGLSKVSSFEANVANSLVKSGFDIGIVISQKKSEFRISMRANKKVCNLKDIHLGKILKEISEQFGGSGGGHFGAASFTGTNDLDLIKKNILEKIKQILSK